jgi:NADH:ubiquinone oxidoreductase subunit K
LIGWLWLVVAAVAAVEAAVAAVAALDVMYRKRSKKEQHTL